MRRVVLAFIVSAFATQASAHPGMAMTDAQKACFTANGVEPPGPHHDHGKARPDKDAREKIHECLKANGFTPPPPPEFTDAQKACFTDNGLPLPGPDHEPGDEPRPTREVMHKVHECLEQNGFHGPHHPH